MDFGLRDWLLVIGPVFIIGVLLHGYLRMRSNRNTLKMSLDASYMSRPGEQFEPEEDMSLLKAELPNGGARVRIIPEQTVLGLDEDVPVLMEPVETRGGFISAEREERTGARSAAAVKPVARQSEPKPERAREPEAERRPKAATPVAERPEHYVVLYVSAVNQPFEGQELLESLVELDMQFGEMDIFHRMNRDGESIFSLVNAVEPGTFDLNQMDQIQTPAVSLFMRTHELDNPVAVFDAMMDVAHTLAEDLGGEVKDQSRSVMTSQTIEHCREQIRDYQHRYH